MFREFHLIEVRGSKFLKSRPLGSALAEAPATPVPFRRLNRAKLTQEPHGKKKYMFSALTDRQ